jgi:hypothetical protein
MSEDYITELLNELSNVIHNYSKSSEKTHLEERDKLWKEKHGFLEEIIKHSTQLMEVACKTSFTRSHAPKTSKQFCLSDRYSIECGQDDAKLKSISLKDGVERNTHILKELLSDEYRTPHRSALIAIHLGVISLLYSVFPLIGDIPVNVERKIDFVMLRLVKKSLFDNSVYYKMSTDYRRTERSIKAKRKTKADRKQPVLETYHKIHRTGMRPHRIATIIKEFLEKRQQDVPCVSTIKRYLREDKLI